MAPLARSVTNTLLVCVGILTGVVGYLYTNKKNCFNCTFTLGASNIPLTKAFIQDNAYPLKIDFGSAMPLCLPKDILNSLKKISHKTKLIEDLKGNQYESRLFLIPKIKIGNQIFLNVIAEEMNDDYTVNSVLSPKHKSREEILKKAHGVIGRPLLEQMNLIMDCKKGILQECHNVTELEKQGYSISEFAATPFARGRTGVILPFKTDLGVLRLSLDTGTTISMIKNSCVVEQTPQEEDLILPYWTTAEFTTGDLDFGTMKLHLFDIADTFHDIDGILGMDFLEKHVIYINNKDNLIYIQR